MASRFEITDAVLKTVSLGGAVAVFQAGAGASAQIKDLQGNNLTLYQAETGATTVANPLTVDSAGRIEGWVEAPDFKVTISGTGITTYTQEVRQSPAGTFNVKSYGAKGDGSNDDTAAIQAALTAGTGGTVYFPLPSSYYKVTATLTVPASTVVEGQFGGSYWAAGTAVIKKTNGDTGGSSIFTPGTDCVFRNLQIEGPDTVYFLAATYPAGTNNPAYGINASSSALGMRVEHCTFRFFRTAGITGAYDVPVIRDSQFISCLRGIDWAANDGRVFHSVFRHCVHTGFRTTGAYTQFVGNRVEWNARYGAEMQGQATVVGNIFDRNGWAGLYFVNGAWGYTVTGNYFCRNAAGGDSVYGRAGAITTTATDTHGNIMYLEPGSSTLGGVGTGVETDKCHIRITAAKYGTITGNRFVADDDDAGTGARSPKYVYALENVDKVTLLGNQDEIGWQQNIVDLGSVAYREGAGSRIYTTGTVSYADLNSNSDVLKATNNAEVGGNLRVTSFITAQNATGQYVEMGVDRLGGGQAQINFGSSQDVNLFRAGADQLATNDELIINTVGKGLRVKEGSNARMGTATMVAGTVVVSTTAVATGDRIFITPVNTGGTAGFLSYTIVNATSFTVTSTSGTDTRTFNWFIVRPA